MNDGRGEAIGHLIDERKELLDKIGCVKVRLRSLHGQAELAYKLSDPTFGYLEERSDEELALDLAGLNGAEQIKTEAMAAREHLKRIREIEGELNAFGIPIEPSTLSTFRL